MGSYLVRAARVKISPQQPGQSNTIMLASAGKYDRADPFHLPILCDFCEMP